MQTFWDFELIPRWVPMDENLSLPGYSLWNADARSVPSPVAIAYALWMQGVLVPEVWSVAWGSTDRLIVEKVKREVVIPVQAIHQRWMTQPGAMLTQYKAIVQAVTGRDVRNPWVPRPDAIRINVDTFLPQLAREVEESARVAEHDPYASAVRVLDNMLLMNA